MKRKTSSQILGERIRVARRNRGLSQEDLALEANIDRSYIGGVERGTRNPSFKILCQIASLLGSDVGALTTGLPQPHEKF